MTDSQLEQKLNDDFKAFRMEHDNRIALKYVEQVPGKALSDNNYTTIEKDKLAAIDTSSFVTNAALSEALENISTPAIDTSNFVTNAALSEALENILANRVKMQAYNGKWYNVLVVGETIDFNVTFRGYTTSDPIDSQSAQVTVYKTAECDSESTELVASPGDVVSCDGSYYMWVTAKLDGFISLWKSLGSTDSINLQDFASLTVIGEFDYYSFDYSNATVYIEGEGYRTAFNGDVIFAIVPYESYEVMPTAYFLWVAGKWTALCCDED